VFTAGELLSTGYPGRAGGEIYAVFEVSEDPEYVGRNWDGVELMQVLTEFEARMKQKKPVSLGHTSAYPRILSLRELLRALK
jgi:hypothetical protein